MIVFVSDAFKEDYIGGAELTTEAIIEDSLTPVLKIHSQKVFFTSDDLKFYGF